MLALDEEFPVDFVLALHGRVAALEDTGRPPISTV